MPNTIDAIYKYIAKAMRERGFTVTTRTREVVGQHPQYTGLRFVFTTYSQDHSLSLIVKRRTGGSGYVNLLSLKVKLFDKFTDLHHNKDAITVAYTELAAFIDVYDQTVIPILEQGYPTPYKFANNCIYLVNTAVNWGARPSDPPPTNAPLRCVLHSQLREAEVQAIVTINHGYGTVNIHPDAIQQPGIDCWFMLEVASHSQANGSIITDGKQYWPVTRIHKQDLAQQRQIVLKLLHDFGKATLKTQLSSLDQQLVNAAITAWCQKYYS